MTSQNKALVFKKIPKGYPTPGEDIVVESTAFDPNSPAPENGLVLKTIYASFDPYMRGRMRPAAVKSYSPAFAMDKPIDTLLIAQVTKSNCAKYKEGDLVRGTLPLQEHIILTSDQVARAQPLPNPAGLEDLRYFLGPLGMPGLTAYSSLYEIGQPKKGQTIFVSSAAGAVGQMVGQLAKHEGLTVIGSVGSDEKLEFITKEIGFDSGFNYKKESVADALARLAPQGIDIYYENVGGEHLEAALNAMNNFGRIVACGMISQYNVAPKDMYPIKNLFLVVSRRLTMRGFIVGDEGMGNKWAKEHLERVSQWIKEGSFKPKIYETVGIDNAGTGFVGMLKGENFGKAVLKL